MQCTRYLNSAFSFWLCFSSLNERQKTECSSSPFVPSLQSQSYLLQAERPGLALKHRHPTHGGISAHHSFSQTGCCPAAWHFVSRPAEERKLLNPEERGGQMFVHCCFVQHNLKKEEGLNKPLYSCAYVGSNR